MLANNYFAEPTVSSGFNNNPYFIKHIFYKYLEHIMNIFIYKYIHIKPIILLSQSFIMAKLQPYELTHRVQFS